jgi:hypothetical protein
VGALGPAAGAHLRAVADAAAAGSEACERMR